jgi:HAD superfamily hydrolase (TIGR01549 family)
MHENRWVFFDLGWTLVDETDAHLERFGRLRSLGPPYSGVHDAEYLDLCEAHSTHFAPSPFLATLRTLDPAGWESAKDHATYSHVWERLYPEVRELLSRLRESFRLGVIANQAAGTLDRLEEFGILEAFSVVVSSAEAGFQKPDPRIFAHALDLAGCAAADATMVGDRLDNDIRPANATGWRTIRVLQGFARRQAPRSETERPDETIASIGDLTCELVGP